MKKARLIAGVLPIMMSSWMMSPATAQQKLPGSQTAGFKAPAGLTIDGKTNDWDNQFQAYSKQNKFFYTVANDDNNLYFLIQATDVETVKKILSNNITLSINIISPEKKKDVLTFTYPALNARNKRTLASNFQFQAMKVSDNSLTEDDSVLASTNKKLAESGKVKPGGTDANNGAGVMAAGRYDSKNAFTCEIAIPMALLLNLNKTAGLHYLIALNGDDDSHVKAVGDGSEYNPAGPGMVNNKVSTALPVNTKAIEGDYIPVVK